jgi:uncharacterized coiled-coil DUF342 family protein
MASIADAATVQFLHIELDMAHTFLRIASQSLDPKKKQRNLENASRTYERLCYFARRLPIFSAEREEVEEGITELRRRLELMASRYAGASEFSEIVPG